MDTKEKEKEKVLIAELAKRGVTPETLDKAMEELRQRYEKMLGKKAG